MHTDPKQIANSPPTEISAAQALAVLRGAYPAFAPGEVWLVGAGPGDPGLLTLDALAGLTQADVVVHDALVDARVLALARKGARLHFAGKRGGKPSIAQEDISDLLVELARRGQRVLRLKGGDPCVFGRGGEEILALAAAGVPFRIVPGVTAGLAALASAWIPATLRGVNQAIILATGHDPDDGAGMDWSALARTRQPIIIYMGLRNLEAVAAALMRAGLPGGTPAAVIASATLPRQRVLVSSLERIAAEAQAADLAAPALVVIGANVSTRQQILDARAALERNAAHASQGAVPTSEVTAPLPQASLTCEP
jgi:uroporphyrin-III C-methyltransferase